MKTDQISKYLTFLQGIKNEFVSIFFFCYWGSNDTSDYILHVNEAA